MSWNLVWNEVGQCHRPADKILLLGPIQQECETMMSETNEQLDFSNCVKMHMISTVSRLLKILFYHPVSYFSPCDGRFSSLLASALEKHWEVVLLFQQWVRPVFGWGVDLFLTRLHPLRHTHTHTHTYTHIHTDTHLLFPISIHNTMQAICNFNNNVIVPWNSSGVWLLSCHLECLGSVPVQCVRDLCFLNWFLRE
jgi:hypothetical protein